MNILFLADTVGALERRKSSADLQYNSFLPLAMVMAKTPHGPLLGSTLICTIMQNAGHRVELLQMAFRKHQRKTLQCLLEKKPDAVCISTTFTLDFETLEYAVGIVRQYLPKTKIILGGPSVLTTKEMRELGDYSILGEGENSIIPLLQAIEAGEENIRIPGVWYRNAQGEEVSVPAAGLLDMEKNPFPDWSIAKRHSEEFFLVATQRGCAWRCAFCNYPALEGYRVRLRSTENVIQEITENFEKYGIYRYMFADSTFTAPIERCLQLLNAIKRLPFKIEWAAFARVDTITPEIREAMVESGCVALYLGIESGDDATLKRMNKGFTVEQVRRAVALLKTTKIKLTASWIIGWPGETADSVRRTVDLASELNCDQNNVNTFWITDLSPANLRPEKFNLETNDLGWKHKTMSFSRATRWTRWALLTLLCRGVLIGSLFDLFWLASLGLSLDEIDQIFRSAQGILAKTSNLKNHLSADMYADIGTIKEASYKLTAQCGKLLKIAAAHPVYADQDELAHLVT